jgi:hypothetical protein
LPLYRSSFSVFAAAPRSNSSLSLFSISGSFCADNAPVDLSCHPWIDFYGCCSTRGSAGPDTANVSRFESEVDLTFGDRFDILVACLEPAASRSRSAKAVHAPGHCDIELAARGSLAERIELRALGGARGSRTPDLLNAIQELSGASPGLQHTIDPATYMQPVPNAACRMSANNLKS